MAYGDAPTCRHCGRIIRFILTKNGKWLPCDGFSEPIIPTGSGGIYYEEDGTQVRGKRTDRDDPNAIRALVPHFITCPKLNPPKKTEARNTVDILAAARAKEAEKRAEAERIAREKAEEAARQKEWEERQCSLFGR